MIKIDISKAIPGRLGAYLLGIIPGLFFISSIAVADPRLATRAIAHVQQIYRFPSYGLLVIAGGISLIVGHVFFILSWVLYWLLNGLYRFGGFLVKATIGSDWFYRLMPKIQGFPPKQTAVIRFLWKAHMWGKEKRYAFNVRPVLRCQQLAAEQILKRRYGISPSRGHSELASQEWQVWVAVLDKPSPGLREAYLAMRTILACAITGFFAIGIEPQLRNCYFVFMSVVFAFAGVMGAWEFTKIAYQPKRGSIVRLGALLRELANTKPAITKRVETEEMGSAGDDAGSD